MHECRRDVIGEAEALDVDERGVGGQAHGGGRAGIDPGGVEGEDRGRRLRSAAVEVVIEAGEFVPAVDHLVGHGGSHSAAAHEEAAAHEFGDGAAHGRAGEVEPIGQGEFVLEGIAGLEGAVLDDGGELLRELVIERHRARAVDDDGDRGHSPHSRTFDLTFVLVAFPMSAQVQMF